MIARLRSEGLLGKVLDVGADGDLSVTGRSLRWTEAGNLRWEVDASQVTIEQMPSLIRYDLILRVNGERWRFVLDSRPINTFTRGLLIAARRRDAALAVLRQIEDATRRG